MMNYPLLAVVLVAAVGFLIWIAQEIRDHVRTARSREERFATFHALVEQEFSFLLDEGGRLSRATRSEKGGWPCFEFDMGSFKLHMWSYMGEWEVDCQARVGRVEVRPSSEKTPRYPLEHLVRFFEASRSQDAAGEELHSPPAEGSSEETEKLVARSASLVKRHIASLRGFFAADSHESRARDYRRWRG
jgi:hypothetical protein